MNCVISLLLTISALAVAAYIWAVAQRNSGRGTYIGGDVITIIYVILIALTALAAARLIRSPRKDFVKWAALMIPFVALAVWMIIHHSGLVISKGAVMDGGR